VEYGVEVKYMCLRGKVYGEGEKIDNLIEIKVQIVQTWCNGG
jgi:hypothetical protein